MSYGRRECAPIEYADRVVLLHTARGGEATIFRNGDVRLHGLLPTWKTVELGKKKKCMMASPAVS